MEIEGDHWRMRGMFQDKEVPSEIERDHHKSIGEYYIVRGSLEHEGIFGEREIDRVKGNIGK